MNGVVLLVGGLLLVAVIKPLMKRNWLGLLLCAVGMLLLFLTACSANRDGSNHSVSLRDTIIETAFHETSGIIENVDEVYVDELIYGSFTAANRDELLVLLKYENNSHIGGLDRTTGIILDATELNIICYHEFLADEVTVLPLQSKSGKKLILYAGKTTYQGISASVLTLYSIENGVWNGVPTDYLGLNDEMNCYICCDGTLIMESDEVGAAGAERPYSLAEWNADQEMFVFRDET